MRFEPRPPDPAACGVTSPTLRHDLPVRLAVGDGADTAPGSSTSASKTHSTSAALSPESGGASSRVPGANPSITARAPMPNNLAITSLIAAFAAKKSIVDESAARREGRTTENRGVPGSSPGLAIA